MGTKKKAYEKGDIVRFSNSTLGTFEDCPRCFWLEQRHGIKHPRGPFPSLPGGVDRKLEGLLRTATMRRPARCPPEMAELVGATPYPDRVKMEYWRNWRNLIIDIPDESGVVIAQLLWARLTTMLNRSGTDGLCSPYDYKTRGAPPVEGASEELLTAGNPARHLPPARVERGCQVD